MLYQGNPERCRDASSGQSRVVRYCKQCLTPDTRPRIIFDAEGVCNACRTAAQKKLIDWDARRKEFLEYIDRYRPKSGPYDCIVPWSGGKDSSSIALKLKTEFGLNPLLVTFSPQLPTEVGNHNREELLKLGFDQLTMRANQKVSRYLARRFFRERGNHRVAWGAGVHCYPVSVAVKYEIPLIFYAEHGDSEYGGLLLNDESQKIRDFTEVVEHLIGDHPENWIDDQVSESDLAPYVYPNQAGVERVGVKALWFSYFFRWSAYGNYLNIRDKIDFRTAHNGRTDGTFTSWDSLDDMMDNSYYYFQFIKFGFGRASRDASRMIQNHHISREEGLELVRKYDDEYPRTFFEEALDYLGVNEREFNEVVDLHRNSEIWKFEGNQWKLRYPVE